MSKNQRDNYVPVGLILFLIAVGIWLCLPVEHPSACWTEPNGSESAKEVCDSVSKAPSDAYGFRDDKENDSE